MWLVTRKTPSRLSSKHSSKLTIARRAKKQLLVRYPASIAACQLRLCANKMASLSVSTARSLICSKRSTMSASSLLTPPTLQLRLPLQHHPSCTSISRRCRRSRWRPTRPAWTASMLASPLSAAISSPARSITCRAGRARRPRQMAVESLKKCSLSSMIRMRALSS